MTRHADVQIWNSNAIRVTYNIYEQHRSLARHSYELPLVKYGKKLKGNLVTNLPFTTTCSKGKNCQSHSRTEPRKKRKMAGCKFRN